MSGSFDRIWNDEPFYLDPNVANAHFAPCVPAVVFQAWIDALFETHLVSPTILGINQLKLVIQDRYFLFKRRLPAEHTQEDSRRPDHRCVYSIFESAIDLLHKHELMLAPPPISISRPRPRKPRSGLAGILLGDIDPDQE